MQVSQVTAPAGGRRPAVVRAIASLAAIAGAASLLLGVSLVTSSAHALSRRHRPPPGPTYAALATGSISMLEHTFYNGNGLWHMCVPVGLCNTKNKDWGADNLTYDLYLRWQAAGDPTVVPLLARLAQTAVRWTPSRFGSSDNMMWDAVAEVREYQATGSRVALAKAEAAFARLNAGPSGGFATGACPAIDYQWPFGHRDAGLKTLETDSNYVKAALLLYQVTRDPADLLDAELKYAAIRRYFLSPAAPLYTDFVEDNGTTCQAIPGIFLGSVNGNMIWAGAALAADTGSPGYLRQAIATARAVCDHLRDSAGVYNGLFADIDVGEPLVEAMYDLATSYHLGFARNWLLTNASAVSGDMNSQYETGRFYDGPPPSGAVSSWGVNGGVALLTAAASLDGAGRPAGTGYWRHAVWVRDNVVMAAANGTSSGDWQRAIWVRATVSATGASVRIRFTGRAIAIVGTIGDVCCRAGFASVAVDGVPTFSDVGIWQNRSSPARRMNNQILFAWRWLTAGPHTITISPGGYNLQQGGAYFHMTGYLVVR